MSSQKIHLAHDRCDTLLPGGASTWTLCGRRIEVVRVRSAMTKEVTCGMCKRLFKKGKTWSRS
jgi:hypothetical protein